MSKVHEGKTIEIKLSRVGPATLSSLRILSSFSPWTVWEVELEEEVEKEIMEGNISPEAALRRDDLLQELFKEKSQKIEEEAHQRRALQLELNTDEVHQLLNKRKQSPVFQSKMKDYLRDKNVRRY